MSWTGRGPVARVATAWMRWRLERAAFRAGGPPPLVRADLVDGVRWVSRRPAVPAPPGAPVVILVHGLGTSGSSLLRLLHQLAPRWDVWAPDLPGFGASDRPTHTLDLAELADALVGWMDAVGIEQAEAVGHSMGCQVIEHVVIRHPGRVRRAVLVGATIDPRARTAARQVWRIVRDAPYEPFTQLPWVAADYLRCGPLWIWRTLDQALASPIEDLLPHVDVPSLVVRGQHDPVCPRPWAEEMVQLMPDARAVTIPGAAHGVTYSHPEPLAAVVQAFFATDDR